MITYMTISGMAAVILYLLYTVGVQQNKWSKLMADYDVLSVKLGEREQYIFERSSNEIETICYEIENNIDY